MARKAEKAATKRAAGKKAAEVLPKKRASKPKIINRGYAVVDVSILNAHPRNKRVGDVDAIGDSVEANGLYGALVVRKRDKLILKGHHTLQAAVRKGLTKVPVIWVEVDDATAERILLADNRTNDLASYDFKGLADQLSAMMKSDNLFGTGFSEIDVSKMIAHEAPPANFVQFDANQKTQHQCPKCGYEFNGAPKAAKAK